MKKSIFSIAAMAVAMLWCSSCQEPDPIVEKGEVVDFEEAVLGSLTLNGYNPTTYENVLAGKSLATTCTDPDNQLNGCLLFDGILYSESGANIGSFFSDFSLLWGGTFDTVYAFVVSSNNELTVATVHNQYSVYSATNEDNKFAVAYDGTWWSPTHQNRYGVYDLPTIEFDKPVKPISAKIANTTYAYLQIMQNDPKVHFAMKAIGYLNGDKTAEVPIILAANGNIITDWKSVSLEGLGEVDKVSFTVDWSRTYSETKAPETWCPFSFCIDDFCFRR